MNEPNTSFSRSKPYGSAVIVRSGDEVLEARNQLPRQRTLVRLDREQEIADIHLVRQAGRQVRPERPLDEPPERPRPVLRPRPA